MWTLLLAAALFTIGVFVEFTNNWITEYFLSFLPQVILMYTVMLSAMAFYMFRHKKNNLTLHVLLFFTTLLVAMWIGKVASFYQTHDTSVEPNSVRVLYANVHHQNQNFQTLEDTIETHNPDIVLFVEFSEPQRADLNQYLKSTFSYSSIDIDKRLSYSKNVVFSIYPVDENADMNIEFDTFTIQTEQDRTLTLVAVHTLAPIGLDYFNRRNAQLQSISNEALNCRKACIIAGDFNVSPWSSYYKAFEQSIASKYFNITKHMDGLFTWRLNPIPIFQSHIDHIFVTDDVEVNSIEKYPLSGSDHDAFVVDYTMVMP